MLILVYPWKFGNQRFLSTHSKVKSNYVTIQGLLELIWTVYSEEKLQLSQYTLPM